MVGKLLYRIPDDGTQLVVGDGLFQGNSPYWAEVPTGTSPFTVAPGAKTDLGDIALDVFPNALVG